MRTPCLLIPTLLVACDGGSAAEGPLPDVQRAGEIALDTGSAAAFLKLYPGATPEGAFDECEKRIGRGERCGGARHIDVTLSHRSELGDEAVLLVEVGPRGRVLHIDPSPASITDATRCETDEDCKCSNCSGCVNLVNFAAKRAAEAEGCRSDRCTTAGCRCSGGKCRIR